MPQPFYLCKTNSDIESYQLEGDSQLSLVEESGTALSEGEALSTLNFEQKLRIGNLNLLRTFNVHHDYKVKKKGFVFEKHFNYYFEQNDFKIYYDKRKKLLVLNASKDVSIDFLRNLKNKMPSFDYDPIKPNINKVVTSIGNLKGAWLDVKKHDTEHAGYFGPSIDNDIDVKNGLKKGQVKYINFNYEYNNDIYYVGLSAKGNIVIYADELSEEEKLKCVFDIYNKLLK